MGASPLAEHAMSARLTGSPTGRRCAGFAFITAIFVLVILATFASFVISFSTTAAATSAVAVQGARAYEAARTGIEWASWQLRDPTHALAPGDTPGGCFASPTSPALPQALAGFSLQVTCERFPSFASSPNFHEEGARRVAVFVVIATASSGSPGTLDYVERRLEASLEVCKDPNAPGPAHACR
jgi:MSHA biogenesis protein MshP